jgi:hypothetical protein
LCLPLTAQKEKFSLQLDELIFHEFVDSLENRVQCRVFYVADWVDSLYVSVDAEQKELGQIMEQALAGSDINYLITANKEVILSLGFSIKANFHENFLRHLEELRPETDTAKYSLIGQVEDAEQDIKEEFRLHKIGNPAEMNRTGQVQLSGTILHKDSRVPVMGAIVYIRKLQIGTSSDAKGNYTLLLPRGQHTLEFRRVGMKSTIRNLRIYSGGIFHMEMEEKINQLEEVTVSAEQENQVLNLRMGTEKINIKMLKQIPMGLGEVDVIKSSLLLPGVQSVGEAAAGYNVRGGSTDQNLMLLNDAPILNPSHFFGFFSTFNSDVIGDVTQYKSGIPAAYGGRISSVMDVRLREGNKEEFKLSGGISPVTGKLLIEGPVKNKATYILSARSTYSNWILRQLDDVRLQNSSAGFYDIQGMTNIQLNPNNYISLSGYYSKDLFDFDEVSAFSYVNGAATILWHHEFMPKLSADFSAILSDYSYQINSVEDPLAMKAMRYRMDQRLAKASFTYFPTEKHKINFGLNTTYYELAPGERFPLNDSSTVAYQKLEEERALESSIYISDVYSLSPSLTLSGGLRLNLYTSFGPGIEYRYAEGAPLAVHSVQDTIYYSGGEVKSFYPNLEFRLSSRILLSRSLSLKVSFQRMFQYIYMLSNTAAISPTDIWKLSDNYIKPQRGDQYSLGVYRNFRRNTLEASIEGYYKDLDNIIDYKGGAELLMNDKIETVLLNGKGKAYGIEFMVKKNSGSLTGWISYTYARILHKVEGDYDEEIINNGNFFPALYDKPHDLKLVINAKLSRRINLSGNFVYNTGRPITYPVGYFQYGGVNRFFYSDRNEFRMPDYIRLDLAATYNGNLLAKKWNHSSLTFAIYNVLGRRNPYSVFFGMEEGVVSAYQLSIFGKPIFTITYNFKIRGNASDDF